MSGPVKAMVLTLVLAMALLGCAGAGNAPRPADKPAQPVAPKTSPDTAVVASNRLGWALLASKSLREGNAVVSPLSLATALSVLQAGAGGQTSDEFRTALKFPADATSTVRHLSRELVAAFTGDAPETKDVRLKIANGLWVNPKATVRPEYLALLKENADCQVGTLGEKAREQINEFVRGRTEEQIPELLPAAVPSAEDTFVLVNALTFRGRWERVFDPERTKAGEFRNGAGDEVSVPMMRQAETLPFVDTPDAQIVTLPYVSSTLGLTVILPKPDKKLAEVERQLGEHLDGWLKKVTETPVDLILPRFSVETSQLDLVPPLSEAGLKAVFTQGADLSGIAPNLYLSRAVHSAKLEIDEVGTVASAATVLVGTPKIKVDRVEVTVNRPFLAIIRDQKTGLILFVARVTSIPAAK